MNIKGILIRSIVFLIFIAFWYFIALKVKNDVILPNIGQIAQILTNPTRNLISMGSLFTNIIVSLVRVVTGYIAAVCIAIPLGIFMGYYGIVYKLLNNFLSLFRPIPPLAWVPLILAWFGITSFATLFHIEKGVAYVYLNNLKFSMVFIIFIGAFYPILTSTIHGIKTLRNIYIDSAKVLGANQWDIFRKILLPAASPSIVNGMRIGLGVAWMCLVSAEMLPGSLSGVGYLITHAYTIARTDIVIACMISIGAVGAILDLLFRIIEERKFSWTRLMK